jgi:glyoxylase-like metal-dependent hydrolase (beta-lactamase superfamily II)
MLKFKVVPVGMLQVNCYLVWHERSLAGYVIDPGGEPEKVVQAVRDCGMRPVAVLLTHAHVDHISGVTGVAEALSIPVYVHGADREMYGSPDNALLPWLPAAENLPAPVDEPPAIEGLEMRVIETPGHTPGGVCYYFPDSETLFSGDTLFQNSIGRTDLPGGSLPRLMQSIENELATLPPQTKVYPGHGPSTTIAAEAAGNPYL